MFLLNQSAIKTLLAWHQKRMKRIVTHVVIRKKILIKLMKTAGINVIPIETIV